MKKVGIALAVVLVLGVALLAGLSDHGFQLGGVGVTWSADEALLEKKAQGFLVAIQYKDFDTAARYHTYPDQAQADIPRLIERLFKVKPEQLYIDDIRITEVTIDPETGTRGRTRFTCTVTAFNSARKKTAEDESREVEGVLFWHLVPKAEGEPPEGWDAPPEGEEAKTEPDDDDEVSRGPTPEPHREGDEDWYLMLESSLRR